MYQNDRCCLIEVNSMNDIKDDEIVSYDIEIEIVAAYEDRQGNKQIAKK